MSSKTLALAFSENTKSRDASNFTYHFQATPFILGYRVVGDKILISQAPKYITESLAKTEMALTLSDNTRSRDASNFTYHFQNCTALTTQCSATFSVSNMSAAAPLTQKTFESNVWTPMVRSYANLSRLGHL
jgi:hypothetical protein